MSVGCRTPRSWSGPALLTGLVAPHAGAASGAASTQPRVAPPALLDPGIGPLLGDAGEPAAPVHLSAADQHLGLLAVGRPGTGKSVLIRLAYAWNCLERVHPSGRPGHPGARNTLIAFESKGERGRRDLPGTGRGPPGTGRC